MNLANISILFKNLPQGNWGKPITISFLREIVTLLFCDSVVFPQLPRGRFQIKPKYWQGSFSSYEIIVYDFSGTKWLKRMFYIDFTLEIHIPYNSTLD